MKFFPFFLLLSLVFACTPKVAKIITPTILTDEQLRQKADDLAHQFIITDGHVDLPYRLKIQNFRLNL